MLYFTNSCRSFRHTRAAALSLSVVSILSALPARAFTLADSQGSFSFTNFSTVPFSSNSSARTDTFTIGSGTAAIANADALFVVLPNPEAGNLINNSAFGNSAFSNIAIAQSEASIIGDFAISAGETFSFDFAGTLDLLTAIGQPTNSAAASLGIQYSVFALDPNTSVLNELDFLTLFGEVNTPGADGISAESSAAIALSQLNIQNNTSATQTTESISAQVNGRYSRFFDQPTTLTLAEVKVGAATIETQDLVEVPAPDISIVWWAGVIGAIAIRKRGFLKSQFHKPADKG